MHPNTNTIQTHQFNWNAWVEWMCKMKCYENLNSEVFGIWENHWNGRLQPFYNGTITCAYADCQGTYTSLIADWTENLNNEVIPNMQAHNFVSSCTVQNNVYVKGSRRYELSNHLGNVLAVVSDRKIESDEDYFYAGLGSGYKYENGVYLADVDGEYKLYSGPDGVISSYSAEVISANDYYAFGSLMPGRVFSGGEYKFGFNGKENDNEVKGEGGQQDYGMRIYDTRLGKFLSVDPLAASYPWYTPYQFAGNMPIKYIDLDGCEPAEPGKEKGELRNAPLNDVDEKSHSWEWDGKNWNDGGRALDETVVSSEKMSSFEKAWKSTSSFFSYNNTKVKNPSIYYSSFRNLQKDQVAVDFMLGASISYMSCGFSNMLIGGTASRFFIPGLVNGVGDYISQFTANGFDASNINYMSVGISSILPRFGGNSIRNLVTKNYISAFFPITYSDGVDKFSTVDEIPARFLAGTIGFGFDIFMIKMQTSPKLNTQELSRSFNLGYKDNFKSFNSVINNHNRAVLFNDNYTINSVGAFSNFLQNKTTDD